MAQDRHALERFRREAKTAHYGARRINPSDHDGQLEGHFKASTTVGTDEVVCLFLAYAKGDEAWRASVTWERQELAKWPLQP